MGSYIRSGLGASVLQSIGKQISRGGVPLRRRLTPFNVSPNWRPRSPNPPVRVVPMSPSAHCALLGGTYINGVCAMPTGTVTVLPARSGPPIPMGDVVSGGSGAPPVLVDSAANKQALLDLLRKSSAAAKTLKTAVVTLPLRTRASFGPTQSTRPTNTVIAPKDSVDMNQQNSPPPVDQEAAIRAECARRGGSYEGNVCFMPRDTGSGSGSGSGGSGGGSSGGGGGGGSYGGGGGYAPPTSSIPPNEDEVIEVAAPASAGISQQHLLLAGAALGLFLLLRRK